MSNYRVSIGVYDYFKISNYRVSMGAYDYFKMNKNNYKTSIKVKIVQNK